VNSAEKTVAWLGWADVDVRALEFLRSKGALNFQKSSDLTIFLEQSAIDLL